MVEEFPPTLLIVPLDPSIDNSKFKRNPNEIKLEELLELKQEDGPEGVVYFCEKKGDYSSHFGILENGNELKF